MLCAGELFPPPRREGGGSKEAGMNILPCTQPRQLICEISEAVDFKSELMLIMNQDLMPYTSTTSNSQSFYRSQTSHISSNRQLSPSPQFSVLTRPSSAEPQTSFNLPNSHNTPLTLQSCNTPSTSSLQQAHNFAVQSRSNNHNGLPHLASPASAFLPSSSTSQFAASIQLPQLDFPPIEGTSPLQSTSASTSCPKLPSIVHTSQQTSLPLSQYQNIKGFLPVNKPVDQTNKTHNNSNSATNTTIPNFPANFSHYLTSQGTKPSSVSQDQQSTMGKRHTNTDSAHAANPINSVIQRPKAQTQSTQFLSKIFDLTTSNFHIMTSHNPSNDMVAKKRKNADDQSVAKRAKLDKKGRLSKKEPKPESVSSPSIFT